MRKKRCDLVQDQIEQEEMNDLRATGEIYRDGLSIREMEIVFRSLVKSVADEETKQQYLLGNNAPQGTMTGVLNLDSNKFWVELRGNPRVTINTIRYQKIENDKKKRKLGIFECSRDDCAYALLFSQCSVAGQGYPNCQHYELRKSNEPYGKKYTFDVTIGSEGIRERKKK